MKLGFSLIVLACFTQVEGTFWDCSSFWPFTMLGFCPVHTRVVTRVGDTKSADKNKTDIGSKQQIPENATSTEISTVKTTEFTSSLGTTESVMNSSLSTTITKLPEGTTPSANSTELTTEIIPSVLTSTTQISTSVKQETEKPKDETSTAIPKDEVTSKVPIDEMTSETSETSEIPREETVSEKDKDETTSEVSIEETSPATKVKKTTAKAKVAKPTVKTTTKSTIEPKDADDDDSDGEPAEGKTESATEVSDESDNESTEDKSEDEETKPNKAAASPTKVSRKTIDKDDVKKTFKTSKAPTAKQSSRGKGLSSPLKPSRLQLVKSDAEVKVLPEASYPVGDNSPLNNYYGSSLLNENK